MVTTFTQQETGMGIFGPQVARDKRQNSPTKGNVGILNIMGCRGKMTIE